MARSLDCRHSLPDLLLNRLTPRPEGEPVQRLMLVVLMAAAAAPAAAAQGPETRSDAQIYFNAEQRLRRAEEEATCAWYPVILHRIINLRTDLRRLERFAERNGDLHPLQRAARESEEQGICIGVIPST